jgi:hypothetical protein
MIKHRQLRKAATVDDTGSRVAKVGKAEGAACCRALARRPSARPSFAPAPEVVGSAGPPFGAATMRDARTVMTASIARAISVLVLALAVFSQGSCVEKVELFCCTTPESCASKDAPYPTSCDPGFVCDETKEFNPIRFTCVASELACGQGGTCSDPTRPECLANNLCGCTSDSSCPASAPSCDVAARACGTCATNADCERFADTPRCDVPSGSCVSCEDGSDCPSPDAPVCSAARQCIGCSVSEDCIGFPDAGHCEASSGRCLACLENQHCAVATAPVCDVGACRACRNDGECVSGLCDESAGSCAPESTVIYISPTGAPGACTRTAPCKTFAQGLARIGGPFTTLLARPGVYSELVVIDGKTVTIVGNGASLTSTTSEGALITIRGASSVAIEGLRIHGADGDTVGDGVTCQRGAGARSLTLRSVRIESNARRGVDVDSCDLVIHGSVVTGNTGGGISIESGAFSLLNNVVAGNGNLASTFGGIRIVGGDAEGSELSFNTITRNQALDTIASGAQCLTTSAFTASSSIVYANRVEPATTAQVSGNCTWAYSDIGPVATAGTGNINSDPMFKAPASGDFHLETNSPAIDKADPKAGVNVDLDGDVRPQPVGGRRDMGADEVRR